MGEGEKREGARRTRGDLVTEPKGGTKRTQRARQPKWLSYTRRETGGREAKPRDKRGLG